MQKFDEGKLKVTELGVIQLEEGEPPMRARVLQIEMIVFIAPRKKGNKNKKMKMLI